MEARAKFWFDQVPQDLSTARLLLRNRRYGFALFTLHLALEKFLKGCIVESTGRVPPRTHDLVRLAEVASIVLPVEHGQALERLTRLALEARYPTNLLRLTRTLALEAFARGESALQWLQQQRQSEA
ncbi:MAG: HEPN domain-containing protein [Dehalococcoidia bacterium]